MKKLLVILSALVFAGCFRDIKKEYIERFSERNLEKVSAPQMRDSLELYNFLNAKLDTLVEKHTLPNMGYSREDLKKTAMGTKDLIPKINKIREGIYFMENYWNGPERED